MSPDQTDVLSEAEIAEIRSSARAAAAVSRPPHRSGYHPSFEAFLQTPVMGPVLFPIPGEADQQKQPSAVPRRLLPIALAAVTTAVAIAGLSRVPAPSSWTWLSSARQTIREIWTTQAPAAPQAPALEPPVATATGDEVPVIAYEAPTAGPDTDAEPVPSLTPGVHGARKRSPAEVQSAAGQDNAPPKPETGDDKVTAAGTQEVKASPDLTAVQPRRDDRTVDQLLDSVVQGQPNQQQEADAQEAVPGLPPLTRDEIKLAMKQLRPRIKDCYRQYQQRGLAQVRIEVGNGGTINSAAVSGRPFAGTPTGECVETAVKTASLPASAGMTFQYPFPVR